MNNRDQSMTDLDRRLAELAKQADSECPGDDVAAERRYSELIAAQPDGAALEARLEYEGRMHALRQVGLRRAG